MQPFRRIERTLRFRMPRRPVRSSSPYINISELRAL